MNLRIDPSPTDTRIEQILASLPDREYTQEDVELLVQLAELEARESFWAFRQYMNPKMKIGWWQHEVAGHFQEFFEDFEAGRKPRIALLTPPQHGKSTQVMDYVSYHSGHRPDDHVIYASYSDRLGVRANLRLQRAYDTPKFKGVFPDTRLSSKNVVTTSVNFLRNRAILEYVGRQGSFRNTTVNGPITGEGLDLGIIDDPHKGRDEANSPTLRNKTWEWFTDDFYGRFSEQAGFIIIMTRWHVDDLVGRMQEFFPDMRLLRYPALAEKDERYRKKGEPLFPEIKSKEFLLERKHILTSAGWMSVYQQSPIVVGGGIFPVERFEVVQHPPAQSDIVESVRYWDKAGTPDGGAYTAGVLMHRTKKDVYVITDVVRGQWSYGIREERIKQAAESDGPHVRVYVEQEPGSGGKESAQRTVAGLAGFKAYADPVSGDKETRAEPYAAQVENRNVQLLAGAWNRDFLEEHEHFPAGKYKDQVDAAAGAFMKLTKPHKPSVGLHGPKVLRG